MDVIPCAMFQTPVYSARPAPLSVARPQKAAVGLSEIFAAPGAEAAATGFVLTQISRDAGPVLWIQDRQARQETGRPFLAGLGLKTRLMVMQLSRPMDVMLAIEEGLRCRTLAAVIAEIRGNHPAVNFTSMKRLVLRSEASGVSCWLIRHVAAPDLSAARDRWRMTTLPSFANTDDPRAPGDPCWQVELFRSRDSRPGKWAVRHERAADRLDLVASVPDGTVAEDPGAAKAGATG